MLLSAIALVTRRHPSAHAVAHGVGNRRWLVVASLAWFGLVGAVGRGAAPGHAQTRHPFDALTCQSTIPQALLGFIRERDTIVRDVLVAPAEAGPSRSAIASCPGEGVVALQLAIIISPASGGRVSRLLPGVWLIDDQAVRFVRRSSAAIGCVELGS